MRTFFITRDADSQMANARLAEQQQASYCCPSMLFYMNASRLQGFRVFDVDGRLQLYILIAAGAAGLDEIR
ncbi:hypothetical protein [Escherichia coli]|uniref:hypothetical protein n=1 Tax=Escherichia coli TaxID=562 RepID=UPI001A07D1DE|nr:hypothetical protein [Escherichia coli]